MINKGEAIGESLAFLAMQERISTAARVDRPVLLIGERGTGKELAASRLHYLSSRWSEPLVALNCSTLNPNLVESELFGYEPGAFTGARNQREGRFERADGGTLFLDEIGLIPLPVQEKILRVVEYGTFERVGGQKEIQVNCRIIGATNADLPEMVKRGEFKADLLDRLSFEVIVLPPLRERGDDVVLLARLFAAKMASETGLEEAPEFSREAEESLLAYSWPGNIRELKNVVERAVYQNEGGPIESWIFNPFPQGGNTRDGEEDDGIEEAEGGANPGKIKPPMPLDKEIEALEISRVRQALKTCDNHQGNAAEFLGISYHSFRNLYRKHKEVL